jgi:thiamine-monophosphate kinase
MKTVSAIGEFGLIARIRQRLRRSSSVRVAIGDDAAVLQAPGGGLLLFASDMLIEGVHFKRRLVSACWVGWKALAVNVSDIAAMGGQPQWAVVSLGLPPTTPLRFVDELYAGLERCARRFDMAIVGGDTVRAPQVVIDVAIVGTVDDSRLTLRSGARVGDALFVTGALGGSYPSGKHARFTPRLREAQELLRRVKIHAMMDLSDGLAFDLWQMSRASRAMLRIYAEAVPVSRAAKSPNGALMDGEDFELLFAVSPRDAHRVPEQIGACPVTRIGRVTRRGVGVEVEFPGGQKRPLIPRGFRHF